MISNTFLKILKTEFKKRSSRIDGFSIRQFASELDMEHSFLAKIFSGKRGVSTRTIFKVGPKLGLKAGEIKKLIIEQLVREE